MRLAYVDPRPVPGTRAEAMQLLQTVDGLAQAGVDVTLIAPWPRDGVTVEDILGRRLHPRVTWLPLFDPRKRWWFPFNTNVPFYRRAIGVLRNLSPDVVMTRHLGVSDHIQTALPDLPLFFELHEIFADSFAARHPQPTTRQRRKLQRLQQRERRVYQRVCGLVSLTDELGRDGWARYGVRKPLATIPNGVDLILAGQARETCGNPENPEFRVLYLGGLHPWKGVDLAVEALAQVPEARLDVVGAGGGGRMEDLRALAEKLGGADRVHFHGAVTPPARRFEIIARADACILPLLPNAVGTSPLKLFEYLAMAKPTVVADLPPIRRLVRDGVDCVLAEPGNPQAFAQPIRHWIQNPKAASRMGEAGQALANRYGWRQRGERLISFFGR